MSYYLKPVYGGMSFGTDTGEWLDDGSVEKGLQLLIERGVRHIDTAQLYGSGESETCIGRQVASKHFTIDTKWVSGWASEAWAFREKIIESAKESLYKLRVSQVDVFYLHSPDNRVSFQETLHGVDGAYRNGFFQRFGISNFTTAETQQVIDICKEKGYVMPTVYQGSYSAAARQIEDELLPLLRKHNIAFYAYSPLAGGFLTKQFVLDEQGRFDKSASLGVYHSMYCKDCYMEFLSTWNRIAESERISKAELAFRWLNHHSALKAEFGDAVVFGATRLEQMRQTCSYLQAGPLDDSAVKEINALWVTVKDDSTFNHYEAAIAAASNA